MSERKSVGQPDRSSQTGHGDAVADVAARHTPRPSPQRHRLLALLGPAFVAAVAYVDPGNVAANITAGARYGYLLVWVLVLANLMAVLVQYQSAKLGIVTGRSLPQVLRTRMRPASQVAFLIQAELVAIATDLAEVVGGAIALNLLTGMSLLTGGCVVGAASLALLVIQERRSQRTFEALVVGLLVIITIGFMGGLLLSPPDWGEVADGLLPRLDGADSLLVAASMLGATVMPHAVYLHSSLVRDHHHELADRPRTERLVRATRVDVVWALAVAGCVNIALLLLAASALAGAQGTDTIEGAHRAITASLGTGIGVVFAVGLLASSLASTSVGAYAGSEILRGLMDLRVPVLVQRLVTLVPALVILAAGAEPTWALVVSQVVLSFGIPFAIVPLMRLTGSGEVMGRWRDGLPLRIAGWAAAAVIIVLNVVLLYLTLTGL